MRRFLARFATALLLVATSRSLVSQSAGASRPIVLDAAAKFQVTNARIIPVEYRGRRALKLAPLEGHERDTDQEMSALLTDSDFTDGVIEVDVAGARRAGYSTTADSTGYKGIVGISFRVQGENAERFYIRPENSRGPSQLYRNRSTQYESDPEYSWQRLRQENPGVYESYSDIESGAWTTLRIEVAGAKARLYINGAMQPSLVVNDLKHGASHGKIALWARISSEAYFANLRVEPSPRGRVIQPDSARFTQMINGRAEVVDYRGRRAVKLVPSPDTKGKDMDMLAILDGTEFKDGEIRVDLSGAPRPGMPPDSRGFIGLAFRTGAHGEWSEVFYLRPTNGRADDQLRRNHSVQYVSHPDYTWNRLRQEAPGVYESYADLEAGAWTSMRIVVSGTTARLYVDGAAQPCLVVDDLKHGDAGGRIALWAHVETDAYFGPITVAPR
jgi:hypothetical protein